MSLEIRQITDEEIEESEWIAGYSFNAPDRHERQARAERARRFFPLGSSLASFEDGEMTAYVRTFPFAMRIDGRALPFGAVGPVVALPQHRRKGHTGALLRRALADMKEAGLVIAGLHTPHPTLYQRFGWEIASVERLYKFAPKDVVLKAQPSERGRTRLVGPDDWALADRVYRAYGRQRNTLLHRAEVWWREFCFAASQPVKSDLALWESGAGEIEGYVSYIQGQGGEAWNDLPRFHVRELVALSKDAYLNLVQHVILHDNVREITWKAPPDDPFPSLIEDASKLRVSEEYDLMLRLCDVPAALRRRLAGAPEAALTIAVTDATAPWNEGTWRVEVANGDANVEATSGEPDLSLSATTLAPVFNGYLSPRAAALAGRLSARDEDALERAEALFATKHPPFCADGF